MTRIPTLSELKARIIADLQAQYGTNIPSFGKNFLRAFAGVLAAGMKLIYLVVGKLQKNVAPDTADPESSGGTLERFGRIKLGRDPFAATSGQYVAGVIGEIAAVIPAGTTFKSDDDSQAPGKLFILDVAYQLVAEADSITLRALEAGTDSRLAIGDTLTATAPIAGVEKTATIESESVVPLAAESIEAYRQKVVDAYQLEPNGGSGADYRLWSADVQGVSRVYPYAKSGAPGEINLFVEATPEDSTDGFGTPSAAMLTEVEAAVELDPDDSKPINERGRRPIGVFQVHYLPVTIKEIDIEIPAFVGLTPALQASIFDAIKAAVDRIRPFVASADTVESRNDILDVNKVTSIILTVKPGSSFGAVVLKVENAPVPTFTFTNGDIPVLNSVTYP